MSEENVQGSSTKEVVEGFEDSFNAAVSDTPQDNVETVVNTLQETPVSQTTTDAAEESVVETETKVETPEQDYRALYEKEIQRNKSWEGRISAAERRAAELQAKLQQTNVAPPVQASAPVVDLSDPLIKGFVEEMGEDFIKPLDAYIKRQINAAIQPIVEKVPVIEQSVTTIGEDRVKDHYDQIFEAHNDVEEIVKSGALNAYIDSLPYSEAVTRKKIIDGGSTKQVISLLNEYKEHTKKVDEKQNKSTVPNVKVTVPKNQLDAATAVKGGSYVVPKGKALADDFMGAFAEAVATH
jgi:hypothetical protein